MRLAAFITSLLVSLSTQNVNAAASNNSTAGLECFSNMKQLELGEDPTLFIQVAPFGNKQCFSFCVPQSNMYAAGAASDPFVAMMMGTVPQEYKDKAIICSTPNCNDPSTSTCGAKKVADPVISCPFGQVSAVEGGPSVVITMRNTTATDSSSSGPVNGCLAYCTKKGDKIFTGVNTEALYDAVDAAEADDSFDVATDYVISTLMGTLLDYCKEKGCMDDPLQKNYKCVANTAPTTESTAGSRDGDTFTDSKLKGNIASSLQPSPVINFLPSCLLLLCLSFSGYL
jgi:hypothetical protein